MTTQTQGGYYFPTHRSDTFAAYYYGRDGRGRYLGQFSTAEIAAAVISQKAGR